MTGTDAPNGQPHDPNWWPAQDDADTNVVAMPRPAADHAAQPWPASAAPFPPPMPQPPPPPPPPPPSDNTTSTAVEPVAGRPRTDTLRNVRTAAQKNRRWIAVAGLVLLGMVVARWTMNSFADRMGESVAQPLDAHNQELTNMVAQIAESKSAPSNVTVTTPLSWLPCPVSTDAQAMIGLDPNTNWSTLDPKRADVVSKQAQALIGKSGAEALRLSAPDATNLRVDVGGTNGVFLITCTGGAAPAKQGGDTATTVAGR